MSLPVDLIDTLVSAIRCRIRDLLYPSFDLRTRNGASLSRFWQTGPRDVLEAGSGNGYFSSQTGARVVAMNCKQEQVEKARLANREAGIPVALAVRAPHSNPSNTETETFDEVICVGTETLP